MLSPAVWRAGCKAKNTKAIFKQFHFISTYIQSIHLLKRTHEFHFRITAVAVHQIPGKIGYSQLIIHISVLSGVGIAAPESTHSVL